MKQIEITVYTIDELKKINEKAYEKVIKNTQEYLINSNFDYASYNAIELLKEKYNLNIDEKNIYYSISYCQGDGFCFTEKNILSYSNIKNKKDMNCFEEWIINNLSEEEKEKILEYLNDGYNFSIIKDSFNYCHAYTCIIDYEVFYSSDDEKIIEDMNDFIYKLSKKLFNEVYVKACKEIEKYLYGYYDIEEDDAIEFIKENDYYYDIDGNIY